MSAQVDGKKLTLGTSMSAQVDGKKLTLGTSCGRERVK